MKSSKELKSIIENSLSSFLPEADKYTYVLEESENYSLSAGGKRLRPCIVLAVCEMLGGRIEDAVPFAAALEFIHTYSLVHDDLPAMDNDDFRRGKPSSHKAYGEDVAILTGDALLTRAFGIMSKEISHDPSQRKAMAMAAIASAAYDMVRGQISDIKAEDSPREEYLDYVHRNKTAALFKAAFASGAYLADASETELTDMIDAGTFFGLAFQLYDDLLDLGTDDCLNYAQVLGKEKTAEKYHGYMNCVLSTLNKYDNNSALKELCTIGDIDG